VRFNRELQVVWDKVEGVSMWVWLWVGVYSQSQEVPVTYSTPQKY